jgi:hypothetical protein
MEGPFNFLPNTENSPLNWVSSLFDEDEPNKSKNKKKKDNNNSFMGSNSGWTFPSPYGNPKTGKTNWDSFGAWSWLAKVQLRNQEAQKFTLDENGAVVHKGAEFFVLADPNSGELNAGFAKAAQAYRLSFGNAKATPMKKYINALIQAKYLPSSYSAGRVPDKAYIDAMMLAARDVSAMNLSRFGNGDKDTIVGKPLTLLDGINLIGKNGGFTGDNGGPSTFTNKSFMSFSDAEARGILESFYADALGRRPNNKEVAKFKNAINAAAKKNPSISTQVTSGSTSTSTSNEGYSQADAELAAREMAESKPGANAFITSTKYMDTFLSILGGKVGRF